MRLSAIAVPAVALALAACGGSDDDPTGATQQAPEPWGLTFVATGITRGGNPVDLVGNTELKVRFQAAIDRPGLSDTRQGVSWRAGCNYGGAKATISGRQLILTSQVTTTDIGCPPPLARQDQWLSNFFSGDPGLRLEGDRLTLEAGGAVIRLVRHQKTPEEAAAAQRLKPSNFSYADFQRVKRILRSDPLLDRLLVDEFRVKAIGSFSDEAGNLIGAVADLVLLKPLDGPATIPVLCFPERGYIAVPVGWDFDAHGFCRIRVGQGYWRGSRAR